ncbi:MAG: hypothetical protein JWO73_506 [Candidatus Taylorbacteria bacterium]|nr:hypothetical protein [Candidatus Taylorbacteria bacterium]
MKQTYLNKYILGTALLSVSALFPTAASAYLVTSAPDVGNCIELKIDLSVGSDDGAKKGEVTQIQQFLKSKKLLTSEPNGYFGPATKAAVKKFQTANKLAASGNVGPLTRTLIRKMTCQTPVAAAAPTPVSSTNASDATPIASTSLPSPAPSQATATTVSSPSAGEIITAGQMLNIRWKSKKGIGYDVILEDSKGATQGYIVSSRYELDIFAWKTGQLMKTEGSNSEFVPPGDYRIRIVDARRSAAVTDQVSGVFTIKEKPLNLISILPATAAENSHADIALFGSGFSSLTMVRFDGESSRTVFPTTVSKDGKIMIFTFPESIAVGQHSVDLYNNYANASSTPSNSKDFVVTAQ